MQYWVNNSGINGYSAEELMNIDFENGEYLIETADAESAIEDLAVKIGLVGDKS